MTFVDNGAPVGYNRNRIIWRKSGNAVPGAVLPRIWNDYFPGKGNGFPQESDTIFCRKTTEKFRAKRP